MSILKTSTFALANHQHHDHHHHHHHVHLSSGLPRRLGLSGHCSLQLDGQSHVFHLVGRMVIVMVVMMVVDWW